MNIPTKVTEPSFIEKRTTDYVWAIKAPDYVQDALIECQADAIHIYHFNEGLRTGKWRYKGD